jgi:nanoRNase/pAp phosphatase (c-di-AMP/oligoRNAs hydrolase)
MLRIAVECRSDRLLDLLATYDQVLVVTHDNPDPDAIAAGWAIKHLVDERLPIRTRFVAGGAILRAENRHMLRLLEPPIELVSELCDSNPPCDERTAAVLVDCSFRAGNHLEFPAGLEPVAVIDHHVTAGALGDVPFADVRPHVAASASIAGGYLREQAVEPGGALATALLYAIRTETQGFETYHSPLDRTILPWLTERADPELVAEIESAPLPRSYFADLALALQNTFLYEDAAFCALPRAEGPEIVGEVADLLIRCDSVQRVLCAAAYGGDVIISVRTERSGDDAAELARLTLDGIGRGGGHQHRAGGKIPHCGMQHRLSESLRDELRDRWLAACQCDRQRGQRLIARGTIVQNL